MPNAVDPPARRPRKRRHHIPITLKGCKYEAGNTRPSEIYTVSLKEFITYIEQFERISGTRHRIVSFRQPKEGEYYIVGSQSVWSAFDQQFKSPGKLTTGYVSSWSCHPQGPRFVYAIQSR